MIYTSYFANVKKLPPTAVLISICLKPPKGYTGLEYKKLAPRYSTLMDYKTDGNQDKYIKEYYQTILSVLKPEEVYKELCAITNAYSTEADIVLLCYEKPENFCHRHLVAEWLTENGFETKEYIF